MPEGPEVRRAADRIAKAIVGTPLTDVAFGHEHLQRHEAELLGANVSAVDTCGKAFVIRIPSRGLSIYVHLQLYGRWYVVKPGVQPNTKRQLRLALRTVKGDALLFSASEIEVLSDDGLAAHRYLSRLGPDILDPALTRGVIMRRLTRREFKGRGLGALYLDQSFLAGVGNYLRSEILYASRLSPKARPRDLSTPQRKALAEATLVMAARAYKGAGVTNDPARVKALKAAGASRRQYRHEVFSRDGKDCYACGGTIERIVAGGRRLYLCPGCQLQ